MKHIASRLISPFLFSIVLSERVSFCSKVIELMQFPIKFIYIFSQWFWPLASFQLFGPVCGGIFKKIISMFLGTYLDYDYDTFFFSNAHSGLQSDGKQKNSQITSNRVKGYTVPVQPYGRRKHFFFTTRDVRTDRAFEITNKMTISQNHSTKNPCS